MVHDVTCHSERARCHRAADAVAPSRRSVTTRELRQGGPANWNKTPRGACSSTRRHTIHGRVTRAHVYLDNVLVGATFVRLVVLRVFQQNLVHVGAGVLK